MAPQFSAPSGFRTNAKEENWQRNARDERTDTNLRVSPSMKQFLAILGLASVFCIGIIYVLARNNAIYLEYNAPYGDISSYFSFQISAYELWQKEGVWAVVSHSLQTNIRDPLRFIFLVLVSPESLADPNGHLLYHGAALFLFLLSFGLVVFKRSNDLLQVLVGMTCLILPAYMFDPVRGLGAMYPDMPGALIFGSAVMTLLMSEGRKPGWLVLFGVFVALTGLARTVAAGYLLWLLLPLLIGYAWRNWRCRRSLVCAVLLPSFLVLLPIVIISGDYAYRMMPTVLRFYSVAGYGLFNETDAVWMTINRGLLSFFGVEGLIAAALVFSYSLIRSGFMNRPDWAGLGRSIWLAGGHIVLIAFVLRVGDPLVMQFALPGIFLLVAAPVRWNPKPRTAPAGAIAAPALIVAALLGLTIDRGTLPVRSYGDPRLNDLYVNLTDRLHSIIERNPTLHRPIQIETAFWEYGRFLVVGSLIRHDQLIHWHKVLQVHGEQWGRAFPGQTNAEIADKVYANIAANVDLFLTLSDPASAVARPAVISDNTAVIYSRINQRIRENSDAWVLRGRMNSLWGEILIYENIDRTRRPSL